MVNCVLKNRLSENWKNIRISARKLSTCWPLSNGLGWSLGQGGQIVQMQ